MRFDKELYIAYALVVLMTGIIWCGLNTMRAIETARIEREVTAMVTHRQSSLR